ncbi:hypothetical protein OHA98_40375 [Streptomyces sp. NBC_00654]|uniref:hypothetical protein n=1 Tax=Streptomyces sp. NBC_00654 TaxID=2975799 RepID=UPI00225991F7|nr:hypothetical protein [Streptomyces sp. NBC_00654]MCX4970892.1 hypothetical protein [Streptomyces sp. NBC_00654]
MKKYALRITVAAVALLATGIGTPASAQSTQPTSGPGTTYGPRCTKITSGRLCASVIDANHDIVVQYAKNSGKRIKARIGYERAGKNHWKGWFYLKAGKTKTKLWNDAYPQKGCPKFIGKIQVKGQQTFQTPPASCN